MINQIAWAVPPGGKTNTRPALLVEELIKLGVVGPEYSSLFHGRSPSTARAVNAGKWWPGRRIGERGVDRAVLSPVYFNPLASEVVWADFYDDWSIAPDINPWHRVLSSLSYKAVASGRRASDVATCNSPYMAAKLGLPSTAVVPNGVDPSLASIRTTSDPTRRLLLLGHFFAGRTDFQLIDEICSTKYFDQVVIGAPGDDPEMLALLTRLRRRLGSALEVHDWLPVEAIASMAGQHTAALVPHVVNDYTLSQDLMKVYTLSALGLRVMCPRLLWPATLSSEFAYLLDYGVKCEETLMEWLSAPGPSNDWRRNVGNDHSWRNRALRVAELIEEAGC